MELKVDIICPIIDLRFDTIFLTICSVMTSPIPPFYLAWP